ncbi:hypothetical protein OG985_05085 [Streptomyces sp. NBC_00289]|uniref:hypothetical protein n=1 Tax=Streptomyces sp. NBC_00289 TaxID=2975703 RepID=UPI00324E47AE
MSMSVKRMFVGAASLAATVVLGVASSASATTMGFSATSTSGKSKIGGTYEYHSVGTADGRTLYDGSFQNASAQDQQAGDGVEAVLALSYDEWTNGAWHHVTNKVAVVNGTDSWSFHDKANVKAWACDRKVGTTALLNIKAAW